MRLKGGDPFVFGRGGEEVAHLQAAGIAVSVVGGMTAGLAAATSLNVSLTHRDHAHGVVLMTGHSKPGDQGVDWPQIAATCCVSKLTLVIYMGVANLTAIVQGLLQGLPGHTPVSVVQNASLLNQRTLVCELQYLSQAFLTEGFASPAIMIVGDVAKGLGAVGQAKVTELTRAA